MCRSTVSCDTALPLHPVSSKLQAAATVTVATSARSSDPPPYRRHRTMLDPVRPHLPGLDHIV